MRPRCKKYARTLHCSTQALYLNVELFLTDNVLDFYIIWQQTVCICRRMNKQMCHIDESTPMGSVIMSRYSQEGTVVWFGC